ARDFTTVFICKTYDFDTSVIHLNAGLAMTQWLYYMSFSISILMTNDYQDKTATQ
ncbi:35265_t:CDS:1, partial [Racocetra persica]